jgi:hypothetical protein
VLEYPIEDVNCREEAPRAELCNSLAEKMMPSLSPLTNIYMLLYWYNIYDYMHIKSIHIDKRKHCIHILIGLGIQHPLKLIKKRMALQPHWL